MPKYADSPEIVRAVLTNKLLYLYRYYMIPETSITSDQICQTWVDQIRDSEPEVDQSNRLTCALNHQKLLLNYSTTISSSGLTIREMKMPTLWQAEQTLAHRPFSPASPERQLALKDKIVMLFDKSAASAIQGSGQVTFLAHYATKAESTERSTFIPE